MGLETVELVMAIEEEFGIRILDAHAERMRTVGDMVDFVELALNGRDPDWKQTELERLDAQLEPVIGRKISELPRETKIVDLLDPEREAEQWEAIDGLPPLERPGWVVWSVRLLSWGAACATFAGCYPEAIGFGVVAAAIVLVASFALLAILTGSSRRIPDRGIAIQRLIWWREDDAGAEQAREVIFEKVAEVIVEQLGVERHEVTEAATFIEDLGTD